MASNPITLPELRKFLSPELLQDVHNFWFDHLQDDEALILPARIEMQRWFSRDSEFDKACV